MERGRWAKRRERQERRFEEESRIAWLRYESRRIHSPIDEEIRAARQAGNEEEEHRLLVSRPLSTNWHEHEILSLEDAQLMREALRLHINVTKEDLAQDPYFHMLTGYGRDRLTHAVARSKRNRLYAAVTLALAVIGILITIFR